jgi:Tetratricopeptide repeat
VVANLALLLHLVCSEPKLIMIMVKLTVPTTLRSASNLVITLWTLGWYGQARQLGGDTFNRCRRVLGEDHLYTLLSATVLVAALGGLGRFEQARQLGEDTFNRCRQVLGDNHPDTLRLAHSLALST